MEPDDLHRFDLVGVPELVAEDPDSDTLAELAATFEMVQTLGDVCELDKVTAFFANNPHLGSVGMGVEAYVGKDGQNLWDRVGASIAKSWDTVIDALDSIVTSPDVDPSAVDIAEAELIAAAENIVDIDDVSDEDPDVETDDDADDTDDADDIETPDPIADAAAEDTFWATVGIDPIRIITSENTYYTLRCYIDDDPIFLGRAGSITVFGSERALARYLADDHDHELAKVSTYADVRPQPWTARFGSRSPRTTCTCYPDWPTISPTDPPPSILSNWTSQSNCSPMRRTSRTTTRSRPLWPVPRRSVGMSLTPSNPIRTGWLQALRSTPKPRRGGLSSASSRAACARSDPARSDPAQPTNTA